jgi:hypothetical protein
MPRFCDQNCETLMSQRSRSAAAFSAYGTLLALAMLLPTWSHPVATACEDPVVVEEAVVVEDGLVVDEEGIVSESPAGDDGDAAVVEGDSAAEWNARPIAQRKVGDTGVYVRQSSDAFFDPDARQALEPKYYFEVDGALPPAASLDRRQGEPAPMRIELGDDPALAALASRFPLDFGAKDEQARAGGVEARNSGAEARNSGAEAQWLDYVSGDRAKLLVVLLPPMKSGTSTTDAAGDAANQAQLLVLRVKQAGDHFVVDKVVAERSIDAKELAPAGAGRLRLDTWDRPMGLGSKAVFLGRVIALLKVVEGRYAVDFYGEALHPDSDCRIWLSPPGHELGTPRGIRFSELPVRKGADRVATAWVLDVDYERADGTHATIALDYPICRPAIMAQMSKLNNPRKPGPDLQKLLGDDLLDEFTRRIVDGFYK